MRALLKQYFGFDEFRPLQEDIVNHVLQGRDTCVIMPTGSGKSLCYQLPALALDGITLVVSPLIALMKDQVDALRTNGVPATCVNSTYTNHEIRSTLEEARQGRWKLIYVAPERLAMPAFQDCLRTLPIRLIAVDEAHCISEWGHDFRPDYRNLSQLRAFLPHSTWIALTATANEQVRNDIVQQLGLKTAKIFTSSFNRPNLTYLVHPKQNWLEKVTRALEKIRGSSAIIYCFSRKDTERIAARLRKQDWKALPYHAGLDDKTRQETQEQFVRDACPIIVATVAFGMGIDKPNVRLVVHADLPRSIEGYYQETGRAGRDGLPSQCLFFYSRGDRWKREFILKDASTEERERARKQLDEMVRYAEATGCRRAFLLRYFGEISAESSCEGCDRCLGKIEEPGTKTQDSIEYDQGLFEKLRALRKHLADEKRVPPYIIFSDRTLRDMASRYPQTIPSLRHIHGVGAEKERAFGEAFLKVIKDYALHYQKTDLTTPSLPPLPRTDTLKETKNLLTQKLSIQEIAKRRGLTPSTIVNHIEKIQGESQVDITHLRPGNEERLNMIRQAFKDAKSWSLTPVRERLGDQFSFEELRLARLFLQQ